MQKTLLSRCLRKTNRPEACLHSEIILETLAPTFTKGKERRKLIILAATMAMTLLSAFMCCSIKYNSSLSGRCGRSNQKCFLKHCIFHFSCSTGPDFWMPQGHEMYVTSSLA